MQKKKPTIARKDRAAEYVDSALMTQRLRCGRVLSVRVDGNYGIYRTQLQLGRRVNGHCTCPSDEWPCKHLRALQVTWKANPESFLDVERFLSELAQRPTAFLVAAIARIVMARPECLSAFGVAGFEFEEDAAEELDASPWSAP